MLKISRVSVLFLDSRGIYFEVVGRSMRCATDSGVRSAVLRIDAGGERATAAAVRQVLADEAQAEQVPQHGRQTQTA